jgi:microcystin-dependent protein
MEGMIGEIRLFAGNFAPKNWAFCTGQIIAIQSNTALFSILGTTYGGNGSTTFALPNLASRVPIGQGQGPGLTNRVLGEVGGSPNTTLTLEQLPLHVHTMNFSVHASSQPATASDPSTGVNTLATITDPVGSGATPNAFFNSDPAPAIVAKTASSTNPTGPVGGNQPFSIMQPFAASNYVICQYGIYPSRG